MTGPGTCSLRFVHTAGATRLLTRTNMHPDNVVPSHETVREGPPRHFLSRSCFYFSPFHCEIASHSSRAVCEEISISRCCRFFFFFFFSRAMTVGKNREHLSIACIRADERRALPRQNTSVSRERALRDRVKFSRGDSSRLEIE